MSFMFPRVVSIRRPQGQAGEGALGYGGQTQGGETTLLSGLRCNIQLRREGSRNTAGLPGDGSRPTYDVRFPVNRSPSLGAVKNRDVVQDDLGGRYQVLADDFEGFGYVLRVEKLEA